MFRFCRLHPFFIQFLLLTSVALFVKPEEQDGLLTETNVSSDDSSNAIYDKKNGNQPELAKAAPTISGLGAETPIKVDDASLDVNPSFSSLEQPENIRNPSYNIADEGSILDFGYWSIQGIRWGVDRLQEGSVLGGALIDGVVYFFSTPKPRRARGEMKLSEADQQVLQKIECSDSQFKVCKMRKTIDALKPTWQIGSFWPLVEGLFDFDSQTVELFRAVICYCCDRVYPSTNGYDGYDCTVVFYI